MQNKLITTTFFLLLSLKIIAQINTVGIVNDENNTPLPVASIVNTVNGNGVITDFDGKFSIKTNSQDILIISYVGYQDLQIRGPFDSNIVVQLIPDNELDEVVLTAL